MDLGLKRQWDTQELVGTIMSKSCSLNQSQDAGVEEEGRNSVASFSSKPLVSTGQMQPEVTEQGRPPVQGPGQETAEDGLCGQSART